MIIADDIPAFSFGRYILISQYDYDTNSEAIITHERSHISLGHFYDLMLMELAKIIFWFNPLIYRLARDLKEIHEFQADHNTLHSGIDATQYQLLIIQKCVGHQKFALANSFNHCQIKNRITMMNKQKTSKAWRWKVATFLPLLALLLMAFGKTGVNAPPEQILLSPEVFSNSTDSVKQWTEKDFNILKPKERESLVLGDEKFLEISMDAQSHITIGNDELMLSGVPAIIRKWRDYDLADDKSIFEKISVNGNEKMASVSKIIIRGDDVPYSSFKELANRIGNTVLEIRGKYSKNIFKVSYSNLSDTQRDEIDKLIPLNVYLGQINVTEVKPAPAQRR
ncbi:M56 family metallopeptidase [Sunxiuqinia sp. sy24]|uniref:M56 family metallopeptidase n=1 Tax=Sunxiuqinia sp. sy24 TaxID=3461495 RepID=UPI0040461EEE